MSVDTHQAGERGQHSGSLQDHPDHQDGMIKIGHHANRLAQLSGDKRDSYPIAMFETQDGQVTLEQIRVMHNFLQEVRTTFAKIPPQIDLIQRVRSALKRNPDGRMPQNEDMRLKGIQPMTYREALNDKVTNVGRIITAGDYAVGEIDELSTVLDQTVGQIESGEVGLISVEQMEQEAVSITEEVGRLEARGKEIHQKVEAERLPQEIDELLTIRDRVTELEHFLQYYQMLSTLDELAEQEEAVSARLRPLEEIPVERRTSQQAAAIDDLEAEVKAYKDRIGYFRFLVGNQTGNYPDARAGQLLTYYYESLKERNRYFGPAPEGALSMRQALIQEVKSIDISELGAAAV